MLNIIHIDIPNRNINIIKIVKSIKYIRFIQCCYQLKHWQQVDPVSLPSDDVLFDD